MHDKNGVPLKKGDRVLIEAIITDLNPSEDYCNVTLETASGRRPDGAKERISAINTGVLIAASSVIPALEFYASKYTASSDNGIRAFDAIHRFELPPGGLPQSITGPVSTPNL